MVREFRDAAGVPWRVMEAEPHASGGSRQRYLPPEYQSGWLVFECATEKRRLAPIPEGWAALTERELAEVCARAMVVVSKSPPARSGAFVDTPTPAPASEATPSSPARARAADSPVALRPKLDAIVDELEQQIEEVCQAPAAERLNTGELIRVEEALAMAADRAKEAISLRRRLRDAQGAQDSPRE